MKLLYHPAANLFPLMEGVGFESLVDDIRENGQREPILVSADDLILDGRNRYRACLELGIIPIIARWDGVGDPYEIAFSANIHRRHLAATDKACIAVKMLDAIAKHRPGIPCAEIAARALWVSPRYIYQAKRIRRNFPKIFKEMERGHITLSTAQRMASNRDLQRTKRRTENQRAGEICIYASDDTSSRRFKTDDSFDSIFAALVSGGIKLTEVSSFGESA